MEMLNVVGGGICAEDIIYNNFFVDKSKLKYLDKLINICNKKDIKVYLVTGPTSMERIYSIDNYQMATDFYNDYACMNKLKYFNLNYLVGREKFLPDTLMYDNNHVNGKGAYVVSEIFAEIIDKDIKGEDISEYFYSSLDDLKKDVNRIISVGYNMEVEDDNVILNLRCLTNDPIVPEYRVLLLDNYGEYIPITDFSSEDSYMFDIDEYDDFAYHEYDYYIFKVEVRQSGSNTIDAYQEYIRTDWMTSSQNAENEYFGEE